MADSWFSRLLPACLPFHSQGCLLLDCSRASQDAESWSCWWKDSCFWCSWMPRVGSCIPRDHADGASSTCIWWHLDHMWCCLVCDPLVLDAWSSQPSILPHYTMNVSAENCIGPGDQGCLRSYIGLPRAVALFLTRLHSGIGWHGWVPPVTRGRDRLRLWISTLVDNQTAWRI